MPTDNQIQRLAAMANSLRPDWPIRSLVTHLSTKHAHRPYRDVAVALAWVATDPNSKTPARLIEAGPWWQATAMTEGVMPVQAPRCVDHPTRKATHCPDCYALAVPKPATFVVPTRTLTPRDRSEWVPPENKPRPKPDATPTQTRTETVSK